MEFKTGLGKIAHQSFPSLCHDESIRAPKQKMNKIEKVMEENESPKSGKKDYLY